MRMRRNIRKHGREGEIPRENPVIPGKDNTIHFSESFAKIDCILDAKEVEEAVEMSPFRLWCLLMKVSKPMTDIHGTSNIDADLHLLSKCRKASKYLVKWRHLNYVDCSWEWKDDRTDVERLPRITAPNARRS